MHEMAASPSAAIAAWESFYVIVGSSAAALTGLQFVVIALVAEAGRRSSNVGLLAASAFLPGRPAPALFAVGAVTLLLVFIGIHNSWDTVTYIAVGPFQQERQQDRRES